MTDPSKSIIGYGIMLEKSILSEFKKIYPNVFFKEEQTERPTIDVSDYNEKPGKILNTNLIGASYFKADPGFKPKVKPMPFIDSNGKLQYK